MNKIALGLCLASLASAATAQTYNTTCQNYGYAVNCTSPNGFTTCQNYGYAVQCQTQQTQQTQPVVQFPSVQQNVQLNTNAPAQAAQAAQDGFRRGMCLAGHLEYC